jgi:hypothetical protein
MQPIGNSRPSPPPQPHAPEDQLKEVAPSIAGPQPSNPLERMARPVRKGDFRLALVSLLQRIRSRVATRPRWRFAQPDPHNHIGLKGRSKVQVFELPFDCQAIFLSPHADFSDPPATNATRAISSMQPFRLRRHRRSHAPEPPRRCAPACWPAPPRRYSCAPAREVRAPTGREASPARPGKAAQLARHG